MNKGYAIGFLIVLLVVVLGLYVAFTGFMSSREALRARPTSPPSTNVVQVIRSPAPTATATLLVIPVPVPAETMTPTTTVPINATEPPPPTQPPAPPPTQPPPALQPDTPVPTVQPPTSIPASTYQFRLAGPPAPDPSRPGCCYIFGTIRDAAGNGLEGVQVHVGNEWNPPAVTVSKGGVDLGNYDIPIGPDVVTWSIFLVDAAGNQISTKVEIRFDPSVANGYRVDWQRTY
jgi:hypothetical protein